MLLGFYYHSIQRPKPYNIVTVEVLCKGTRQGSRMEVSTDASPAPTPVVGPNKMGLYRFNTDQHCVSGSGHIYPLRRLQ